MASHGQHAEWEGYRLILVSSRSTGPLAVNEGSHWRLPTVTIAKGARVTAQLQQAVHRMFGLHIIVLDIALTARFSSGLAIAEVYYGDIPTHLAAVDWDQISAEDLDQHEREAAFEVVADKDADRRGPFSQLGWIANACAWIGNASSAEILLRGISQYSAGAEFALLRCMTSDGTAYWLKATGDPNRHEYDIIQVLTKHYPEYLPRLVAVHVEWNAWLMEEAGEPLSNSLSLTSLEAAARCLAGLQMKSIGNLGAIVEAGAFDHRLPLLENRVDQVVEFLASAMERQISSKVAPISRSRLLKLKKILQDSIDRMAALNIPDTLLHNDLNPGNILYDGCRCVLTDWSEAAVGNPFLSLERLCQLDGNLRVPLQQVYRKLWSSRLTDQCIDKAIVFMRLLAIFAYLYGRGDWLSDHQAASHFESYARSLARHMDREARDPVLLDTLYHCSSSIVVPLHWEDLSLAGGTE